MEEGDNTVRQIIIVVVICLGGLLYRVYSCVKPRFRDMRLDVEESGAPVSRELQSLATSRQALYAHCVPKWETVGTYSLCFVFVALPVIVCKIGDWT